MLSATPSRDAPASPRPPHAPLLSLRFVRAYLVTARPYLFFVSGASGLVGLAMAPTLSIGWLVAAAAGLFLTYGLGQSLTDVFQTDTDALSSPYRPLVRGEISPRQVLGVSLVGLALVALLLSTLNPWSAPLSIAGVAGLAAYSTLKRTFWAGPPCNAFVTALLPALGYLCGGAAPGQAAADTRLWLAAGSVFFGYSVFILLGYLKDVEADRATGYDTLAVHFGRKATVVVSFLHWLAAVVCSVMLFLRLDEAGVPGAIVWLAGTGLLGAAHLRMWPTTRDDQAHPALVWVVAGYVAMQLGTAIVLRPGFLAVSGVLMALLLLALRVRPEKSQL